jgi:peptidoglycan/xylan/chitin deacetylase (PgdA/CDA1 family)
MSARLPAPVVPVLLYHAVDPDPPPGLRRWSVDPARFATHMDLVAAWAGATLTVSQYAELLRDPTAPRPERAVVVTFDDGFADFASRAVPIMGEYGVRSTVYVTTGFVGETSEWLPPDARSPMMSWRDIAALPERSVEVGAHGVRHLQLDVITRADAREEIAASKAQLEAALGREVQSFAYPFGYHGRHVRDMVAAAGFDNACAVKNALSAPHDDPYAIARVIITDDIDAATLERILDGTALRPAPRRERIRVKAWRLARRGHARIAPRIPTASQS